MTLKELKNLLNKHEEELGPETPVCVYSKHLDEDNWFLSPHVELNKGIIKKKTCLILAEE